MVSQVSKQPGYYRVVVDLAEYYVVDKVCGAAQAAVHHAVPSVEHAAAVHHLPASLPRASSWARSWSS